MKLRKSDPGPIEKPDPLLAEQIPISPVSKPKRPESSISLPEKYEMLDKLFHSLDNSIRLCQMKGSAATFTNVSPKIECLTDRRFTYSLLAQIKFILPEAIEIKKILVNDVRTSCMKPDLLLTLDAKAVEDRKMSNWRVGVFCSGKSFVLVLLIISKLILRMMIFRRTIYQSPLMLLKQLIRLTTQKQFKNHQLAQLLYKLHHQRESPEDMD